jgi:hypothetical protein
MARAFAVVANVMHFLRTVVDLESIDAYGGADIAAAQRRTALRCRAGDAAPECS